MKHSRQTFFFSPQIFGILLLVSFFVALIFAVLLGSENLRFSNLSRTEERILFDVRIPRVLLGAVVGASLAISGAGLQALLRNPLAEPYLLGVSSGAALGTAISFVVSVDLELIRPIFAFAGASLATFAVYQMAKSKAGMSVERLALSGIVVTTMLSSIIVLLTTLLDSTRLRSFTFWLLGDLSQGTKVGLYVVSFAALLGLFVMVSQARALNLMMIGERDAFDFGVEVNRVKFLVFITSSALVGVSVSASGSIGYVGLVVPHLVRLSVGSDNRYVLPFSMLAGAVFVVVADTIARVAIAPRELPVGAITAIIGAPMFIYLLKRT
ncbi:MAG: iron ABC transporter permease [Pyrinomonadaceae bacterium]|nr:iron ABC transporter permease [Pyrinomonadaceae bacterium]MCX7639729.1 iron ABC transporter permease [Pyrinomonadaceae bacterium]MDW8304312.1 iron ABC transporter permease [Acidobacteriota bacterium]